MALSLDGVHRCLSIVLLLSDHQAELELVQGIGITIRLSILALP